MVSNEITQQVRALPLLLQGSVQPIFKELLYFVLFLVNIGSFASCLFKEICSE